MLTFRQAEETDLETIVDLLADDPLGKKREQAVRPIPLCYKKAFAAVQGDPNHELIVACEGEEVIGCMQLSFLPGLTYQGGWRMQLEGVRVSADARGSPFLYAAGIPGNTRGIEIFFLESSATPGRPYCHLPAGMLQ